MVRILGFCLPGLGSVCGIAGDIKDVLSAIKDLLTDPFKWLFCKILTGDSSCSNIKNLISSLVSGLSQQTATNFQAMWAHLLFTAGIIVAVGGTIRIVRGLYDERQTAAHLIVDSIFRCGGALLLLAPFGPGNLDSIAWRIVSGLSTASMTIAFGDLGNACKKTGGFGCATGQGLITTIGEGFGQKGWSMDTIFATLTGLVVSTITVGPGIGAILALVILAAVCYFAFMLVARAIMVAFVVATGPLAIATAVFDTKNRFFQWWLELLTGTLMLPVVLAIGIGATAGFIADVKITGIAGGFVDTAIVIGGAWFTGKMINQLAWRHFSHQGMTGALTSAMGAVMAIPNAAADAKAIGGAIKDAGGGSVGNRLASIPGRRLMGAGYSEGRGGSLGGSGGGGTQAGAAGSGGFSSTESATSAATAAATGNGPGWDGAAALSSGSQGVVGTGAAFNSFGNNVLASMYGNPAHQRAVMTLMGSRPEVSAQLAESLVPSFLHNDAPAAMSIANQVIQNAAGASGSGASGGAPRGMAAH